jgi:hypothetical protein
MSDTQQHELHVPQHRGSFRMLWAIARTYPGRTVRALAAVSVASLFEGLGMSMLPAPRYPGRRSWR